MPHVAHEVVRAGAVPADEGQDGVRDRFQLGLWDDPAADETQIEFARSLWNAMRPWAAGSYVNFLEDGDRRRAREAYAADTYDRLVALKRELDPTNAFRLNQNIPPD